MTSENLARWNHDPAGVADCLRSSQEALAEEESPPNVKRVLLSPSKEGGWRSWLVVLAATWCNGSIFGIQNSFGVLYVAMLETFGDSNDTSLRFKTAWVGSLSMGVIFLLSPLVSVCSDRFGCCRTAVTGSVIAFIGILSASFARSLGVLYVTYGVLFAAGCSLAYQPSLVILGRHFTKRLGLVNGVVTAGSSLFTIVMPLAIKNSLTGLGLAHTMQLLSLFMFVLILASCTYLPPATYRPVSPHPQIHPHTLRDRARRLWDLSRGDAAPKRHSKPSSVPSGPVSVSRRASVSRCLRVCDWSVWSVPSYCTWALGVPLALFGYFVPYVHLMNHVEERFPGVQGEILLICIGVTSGAGRLVSGRVVDLIPGVNKVFMQVLSFVVMGLLSMLLPLCPSWAALIALCLGMGLVDGCFICVMAPVAFQLVGPDRASQAIGSLLGLMAVPMTAGPPVAGLLRDRLGSYDVAFYLAGVPPLLGALVLSSVPWFHRRHQRNLVERNQDGEVPFDSIAVSGARLSDHNCNREPDETGSQKNEREPDETLGRMMGQNGAHEPDDVMDPEPDETGFQIVDQKGSREPDQTGYQKGNQQPDGTMNQVPDGTEGQGPHSGSEGRSESEPGNR